ncbi:MAG: SDR family NAD(P)-dependent oxidoreductase [Hyphomicrobiaceae bacterium]|nr:SDR family NAD(P)-dependent oxidoreductase [Hyphomicrobiaceae bacterium]
MDLLSQWGDLWVRRNATPDQAALASVQNLLPATVVTGASAGLGLAFAARIAREGRAVVLLARSWDRLAVVTAELQSKYPAATVIAHDMDVAAHDAFEQITQLLSVHQMYLDVLVNNAGIALAGRFSDQTVQEIDELTATNVVALTRLTRLALPAMRARARGGIINLASIGSFTPGPWQAAYFASKAYVLALTAAVSAECAGEGVRVCAIAFGPVDTKIHHEMSGEASYYRRLLPSSSPERMARVAWRSYRLGRRVVVPGLVNGLIAWTARAMPFEILLPVVGWLMKPR